jgi:ATP-dependent DNA helicase 2 subunit 2
VGVIGLKTEETENDLADDETYANLSVFMPIGQVLMPEIRRLRAKIQLSNTDDGDAISALILAIQMISVHCKKQKWKKRIILVTNGLGAMDDDEGDLDGIAGKIKEENIELFVLGVDFDDPNYGFKEENKDPTKERNERILKQLADDCDGMYGTMALAIEELGIPRVKVVRPWRQYQGLLTLGDPENYDTAMCINVERYGKIMQAKPPSASSFAIRSDMAPGESSTQTSATLQNGNADQMEVDGSGLTTVRNMRAYQVEDVEAPGGKKDVDAEELAKGYEYGRTAVAISQSDMNVVKLETTHCMDIVGFVPREKVKLRTSVSECATDLCC